ELRRLADDRTAEAGPSDAQTLQYRYDAAHCLEQLGEAAAAVAEYRAVLPYYESSEPDRALQVRHRIGHLLLAVGDHTAAQQQFRSLLYDAERAYGPYHPLAAEVRRALERQQQFRMG
ncbi:LOW QUALITY PROTEIN: serine/threonine protein kinase, partial [Streptomyces pristinaespiralis ATCC 25486]